MKIQIVMKTSVLEELVNEEISTSNSIMDQKCRRKARIAGVKVMLPEVERQEDL